MSYLSPTDIAYIRQRTIRLDRYDGYCVSVFFAAGGVDLSAGLYEEDPEGPEFPGLNFFDIPRRYPSPSTIAGVTSHAGFGFGYEFGGGSTPPSMKYLGGRVWFPLLLPTSIAAFFVWRLGRALLKSLSRKIDRTLCPICSYDLRAHKPGDKCPECGTPIPAVDRPNR